MNRRTFICGLTLGAIPAPPGAAAQQPGKMYRIGFLAGDSPESLVGQGARTRLPEFLRRYGYIEGQNIFIEWRWASSDARSLRALADELIRLNVDVILALANGPIAAAKQATKTIPIVMIHSNLPVENGFSESLARPGGNITGTARTPPEFAAKLLELLTDVRLGARRVTILYDPSYPGVLTYKAQADHAAPLLGMSLHYVEVRRAEDFASAFDSLDKSKPDALYVVPTDVVRGHLPSILRFATERRLPTIGTARSFAEAGGLLYYGPDYWHVWERSVSYVDRILRGTRPADLPIEQPSKYELVINLKTAKALGLTIPQSLLLRADQVIE